MIRSLLLIVAILAAAPSLAQQPVGSPISPWPAGAGTGRGDAATVSARATGLAPGTPAYRGRLSIQRRGATREEANAAIEKAMEEISAVGGVDIRTLRREAGRATMEQAQMQFATPSNPLPAIPPRGQMVQVYMEMATVEVEASTRKAIFDWGARLPPQPPINPQTPPFQPSPIITERLDDNDPAWAQATRNALLAAERGARNAAQAAGGDLGRLKGVWTERLSYIVDGSAQVSVTAEYEIARRR